MGVVNQKMFRAVAISLAAVFVFQTDAATLYVSPTGSQVAPYSTWASAAGAIQDAMDASADGDQIIVTNGTYATGGRTVMVVDTNLFTTNFFFNRVVVDKQLTLRSVNGPQFTIIDGQMLGRCVSLGSNAILSGFTLTNGLINNSGGGVCCGDTSSIVSNCTMSGNVASSNNFGGGAYGGTLNNCTMTGNSAAYGGGACNGIINNCIISGNSANQGGGVYGGTLSNCALTKNSAASGGGAYSGTLENCTLTGNAASLGGGAFGADLFNCIAYYNIGSGSSANYDASSTLNFSCTSPLPPSGTNNLSGDPQLASVWHLSANSPCIGTGSSGFVSGVDIDGEPWANPPSIGCDQYLNGSATGAVSATFSISYTNVAVGFPVGFEAAISGRVSASSWSFGDGVVLSNRPYASHAWAATGNYTVVLRAWNNSSPGGVATTAIVHVVSQPVHYVVASGGSPSAPYSSWTSAATNIQDAVDAATVPGALVLVSNGVYQAGARAVYGISNRVAVTKPLMVQSVNGPSVTRIVGYKVPTFVYGSAAVRCAYLTNGAMLSGFTLTNGATQASGDQNRQQSGGAIYCELGSAVVSNCVLTGNSAASRGGGASFGTLNNCTLTNNNASMGGGASFGMLNNCTLMGNSAGSGGGAYNSALSKCVLRGNSASYGGGAYFGSLDSCTVASNSAASGGGAYSATLNNSLLTSNSVSAYGPYGGGAYDCILNNCTVSGNSASGTYPYAGGAYLGVANNSILYFNSASNGPNYYFPDQNFLNYTCTTPDPGGVGNITSAPLFVNLATGNLRLASTSPCINSGDNGFVSSSTDLDSNPRVVNNTVDMGAYEFQGAGSIISYAWLQQYGLPTDGSADFTDPDHDGANNWQEWLAGTNPTNASSGLKIISATRTNNPAGIVVTWASQTTRIYFLQRSASLTQVYSTIQDNILGQPGTTSYTDTTAIGPGPFFYRVGVKSQ